MPPIRGPLRKRESHLWEREQDDHYVEPAWVSERLFIALQPPKGSVVLDPSCGFGTIVESACAAGFVGLGSDILPRWYDGARLFPALGTYLLGDFLTGVWPVHDGDIDAIVSNPPFKHAERYAELALARAGRLVALLLPANWVQGDKRSRWLRRTPLRSVMFICPRPSMPPGHVLLDGGKPGNGTTDYAWFVWDKAHAGEPVIDWLYRDPRARAAETPLLEGAAA